MWRCAINLPERGRIGIFNRSYYEDVLVVRVRPGTAATAAAAAASWSPSNIWDERFEDIRAFERYLARNGTLVLKFFLHVSKEEQRRRFLDRIEEPAKRWKFNMGDVDDRKRWDQYMDAYQDMIRNTARPEAPWYVIPADNKWFARLVVADAMVDAMERLNLRVSQGRRAGAGELMKVRKALRRRESRRGRRAKRRVDGLTRVCRPARFWRHPCRPPANSVKSGCRCPVRWRFR